MNNIKKIERLNKWIKFLNKNNINYIKKIVGTNIVLIIFDDKKNIYKIVEI